MHRWLKWAVLENIIDPADYFMPIRYLRVISALKECTEDVIHAKDKYNNEEKEISVQTIQQSHKSVLKTKSQNISDSLNTTKEETTEDISQWIDLIKLAPYITKAYLFYKLEYFQCSIQITGDILKNASEERKAIRKEIKKEKEGVISFRSIGRSLANKCSSKAIRNFYCKVFK